MDKLIHHVSQAILMADNSNSKLTGEILNMNGQSSYKIRHLLNNIVSLPNANYLEIGLLWGSTFISSMYKNNTNSAYGVDIILTNEFTKNCSKLGITNYNAFECDSWKFNLSLIKNKINIYLYDGEHNYEDQYKALEYYYQVLDDTFIFMVDDWTMNATVPIERATRDSIKDLKFKKLYEQVFTSTGNDLYNWWNGFFVCILKKE